MDYKPYAIACNRDIDDVNLNKLKEIAEKLSNYGFTLRSFGSDVPGNTVEKELIRVEYFLPFKKFNNRTGSKLAKPTDGSFEIAKRYHPAYEKLKESVRQILASNVHMILGENLKDPILFLLVYSPDGVEKGKDTTIRTGSVSFVIKVTDSINVPVINIKNSNTLDRLNQYLR